MRVVLQRVERAKVEVGQKTVGEIEKGLLVFLGVENNDTGKDIEWMVKKIPGLRIFEDDQGKMNRSLLDVKGSMLVISQFTLYGDCRKGRRPSFSRAAPPEVAKELYDEFCATLPKKYPSLKIAKGIFQTDMKVSLINDGPVTLLLDSKGTFR